MRWNAGSELTIDTLSQIARDADERSLREGYELIRILPRILTLRARLRQVYPAGSRTTVFRYFYGAIRFSLRLH